MMESFNSKQKYTLDFMMYKGLNYIKNVSEKDREKIIDKLKYMSKKYPYYKMAELLFNNANKYMEANDKYHMYEMIENDFYPHEVSIKWKRIEILTDVFDILYYLTNDDNIILIGYNFTDGLNYHNNKFYSLDSNLENLDCSILDTLEKVKNKIKQDEYYINDRNIDGIIHSIKVCYDNSNTYKERLLYRENILSHFRVTYNNYLSSCYIVNEHISFCLLNNIINLAIEHLENTKE